MNHCVKEIMNRWMPTYLAIGLGCALGIFCAGLYLTARHANELAITRAAWAAEKAHLLTALEQAQEEAQSRDNSTAIPLAPAPAPSHPAPADIIARLQGMRTEGGSVAPSRMREAVYWLEELVQAGPRALPAIRQYLARNEDVELDTAWVQSRAARDGKLPGDFVLPPSLRMGLIEVVRRIGGADAEHLLGETLIATGRGLEVAYLTRLLQEMSPNKHREAALSAARLLLASAAPLTSTSPLDRNHRDYLFGVLSYYGDPSYAGDAQLQLVRADSQVDRSALKYLQQILGAQAVPVAAQIYQQPLLQTNAAAKEPLARLALNFVGADAQANAFYQQAINDPVLTRSHRKNLIEDLNQDGFADTRNLTANDLPLIQARIALIEQLAPSALDEVNTAAFQEAYKDLVNMRAKVIAQAPSGR
jgi:hypothetical protein